MSNYTVRQTAEQGAVYPSTAREQSGQKLPRKLLAGAAAIAVLPVALACSPAPDDAQGLGGQTTGLETTGTGLTGGDTATGTTGMTGGETTGGDGDGASACVEGSTYAGRAPIRRLNRFEYNKTIESVLADDSQPGNSLPPELLGNGFGNDADEQPVSSFLAEQYGIIAEAAAERAVNNTTLMTQFAPCYANVDESSETSCARTFIENFGKKAYRRPLEQTEIDDLAKLREDVQALSDYKTAVAAVIEAVLQGPDFLYRVEFGDQATADGVRSRVTGYEMASRLSYFFWGSPPDEELDTAAAAGQLSTDAQVLAQAQRLLDDPNARPVIRDFFSKLLPIEGLTDLARDSAQFPTFSPKKGQLMRKETEAFLEHEIFEGPGDWKSILTAPYTFVNDELAAYYGLPPTGSGETFVKADLNPEQRMGLLTQASILTGTTVSNYTNPVRRGVFLLHHMMCVELLAPPEGLNVTPPEPSSGKTGRERYSAHSEDALCANCHKVMDPPGFALENFDAVGLWRDQENGVTIDASGEFKSLPAPFDGPLELVQLIAEDEKTHACFTENWLTYAVGRSLSSADACLIEKLEAQFVASGYNIKDLLLQITQTDAFRYRPVQETL